MQKVTKHLWTLTVTLTVLLLTQTSCHLFQPKTQFFIVNESIDKQAVDFKITLGRHTIFSEPLKFSYVRPDLSNTPSKTLPKGKYIITITGDSGSIDVQKTVVLDRDLFIFVTYDYKRPMDSMMLVKKFGYASADRLTGKKPEVGILITDKEPIHL